MVLVRVSCYAWLILQWEHVVCGSYGGICAVNADGYVMHLTKDTHKIYHLSKVGALKKI